MSVEALHIDRLPLPASAELLVLYGSQTGNGETVSESLVSAASQAGLRVSLRSLADLRPVALKKASHAVFVISTHGEGDPPDDALDIFEWLEENNAKNLTQLNYRILALGDKSYTEFCAAAHQLDRLLTGSGARAFGPMVECDVNYTTDAAQWSEEVLSWGISNLGIDAANDGSNKPLTTTRSSGQSALASVTSLLEWTRTRPFPALVQRVQKITGLQSEKDVFHLEFSLQGSGLNYQPGDSLGVWVDNDAELVSEILSRANLNPAEFVNDDGRHRTIRQLLTRHREVTRLSLAAIGKLAELDSESGGGKLGRVWRQLDDAGRKQFMEARQLVDLMQDFRLSVSAQALADLLPPLASRTYSIASSAAVDADEVHLTVVTLYSNANGRQRAGAASEHLNHRIQVGDEVRVFLEPNRRFRLPEKAGVPIIMIAAGTGIAPYRAFMQELEENGRDTDTWLIFGNPHQRSDFLYQREWLRWRSEGLLNRIDVAFSRDQQHKHYVQHVVLEQAEEIVRWIDSGAVIYICGALAMGHEVESSLVTAIGRVHNLAPEAAREKLKDLRRARRLLKDLY